MKVFTKYGDIPYYSSVVIGIPEIEPINKSMLP